MSRSEWEHGEIKLPTGEAAKFKLALRNASNQLHAETLKTCQSWWKSNKTTSHRIYQDRINAWIDTPMRGRYDDVHDLVYETLQRCGGQSPGGRTPSSNPHMARAADVDRVIARANVRTTQWHRPDVSITVEDNTVTWDVGENNHACEHAHRDPIAHTLFSMLDRVSWTRGSGGQISGNDEYNQDDRGCGGGSNYVVSEYGPRSSRSRLVSVGANQWYR